MRRSSLRLKTCCDNSYFLGSGGGRGYLVYLDRCLCCMSPSAWSILSDPRCNPMLVSNRYDAMSHFRNICYLLPFFYKQLWLTWDRKSGPYDTCNKAYCRVSTSQSGQGFFIVGEFIPKRFIFGML